MPTTPPPLVVAVGRHGSATTLEYAGLEALRQDCDLHVVHAVDDVARTEQDGAAVLATAVRRVQSLVPGLGQVTSALATSPAIDAVVFAAEEAPLVVLGRCPEPLWAHPYVRSVTAGVAAGSRAPVVSVLDGWKRPAGAAHVVVGLDDPETGAGVLQEAFAAARAHQARLTVVTTWWRPTGTDRRALTQVDDLARADGIRTGIDRALAGLRETYDDVTVEIAVRNGRPVDVLVEASQGASLLVLGRHDPLLPTGSHLGPVARSVLRSVACPVRLAASRPSHVVRSRERHHAHLG